MGMMGQFVMVSDGSADGYSSGYLSNNTIPAYTLDSIFVVYRLYFIMGGVILGILLLRTIITSTFILGIYLKEIKKRRVRV